MIRHGALHAGHRFKRLLYPRLTVRAHHPFHLQCLCHGFFLLLCHRGNGFRKRFRGNRLPPAVVPGVMGIHQIQPQGVHAHKEAGQGHGRRAVHRFHLNSIQSHRQRNADCVIEKRPEQILMDIPDGCPAQSDRRRHVRQPALHDHDVRGVYGYIRSRADRDSVVRHRQRRGVVDSVADHGHLPQGFQAADYLRLSLRKYAGNHPVHSGLPADRSGRPFIVPGQHNSLNAHVPQLPDRLRRILPDRIRHRDQPGRLPVQRKQQRGFPFFGQLLGTAPPGGGYQPFPGKVFQASSHQFLSVQQRAQPVSGQRLEVRDLRQGQPLRRRCHRPGQRMLAVFFQRGGQAQQLLTAGAVQRNHIRDRRLSFRDGSGFVQRDHLRPARSLQSGGSLVQDAVLRPDAAADHDGHRRREPQRAGAADHQHGNGPRDRKGKGTSRDQPARQRQNGQSDHCGHKDSGNPVRDSRQRRFCRGGVRHGPDDLRQRRVFPDAGRPAFNIALLIDRRRGNRVALRLVHRNAFPAQGGFVHCRHALQNDPVHRNLFSRADRKNVPGMHFLHPDLRLGAVLQQNRGFRSQAHQSFQRVRRAPFGQGFQHFPDGNQGGNHRRGFEIQIHPVPHDRFMIPFALRQDHQKQFRQGINEGSA